MKTIGSLLLVVCISVLLPGFCAYGQRQYATQQTSGKTGGGEVKDPGDPVDFPDLTDPSRLKVNGLAETAYQVLKFPEGVEANTPVTIRLRWKSSVSLLGGLTVQPMMDGTPVPGGFSSGATLAVLQSGDEENVTLVPTANYNGVRISLASGVLSSAEVEIYYAYYLADPVVNVVPNPVCQGERTQLQVLNTSPGLEYRLYTSETAAGYLIRSTNGIFITPPVNAETTFYVASAEGTSPSRVSRRIPVLVQIRPRPAIAAIPDRTVCEGEALDLDTLNPEVESGSTGGSYVWSLTFGGPPLLSNIITPFVGTSTYWVRYTANGCSDEKSVTVRTTPKPAPIIVSISTN